MKKVSIYIDGANFSHASSILKWSVDLARFYEYCEGYGEITAAKYFCAETKTEGQERFFEVLRSIGFEVITKPIKTIYDKEQNKEIHKANCDVEIACTMIDEADNFDTAILVSGDSDFLYTTRKLKAKGKQVIVISTKGIAALDFVREESVTYIDMKSIKEQIERRRPPRSDRECGAKSAAEPECPSTETTPLIPLTAEVSRPTYLVSIRKCRAKMQTSAALCRRQSGFHSRRRDRQIEADSKSSTLAPNCEIA